MLASRIRRAQINALRNVLLGNFEVLYETMLKHHPELFGEADEEAFAAWRSQFAWATAVVSVRGIVTSSDDGTSASGVWPGYLAGLCVRY